LGTTLRLSVLIHTPRVTQQALEERAAPEALPGAAVTVVPVQQVVPEVQAEQEEWVQLRTQVVSWELMVSLQVQLAR
jgi:hypothetical protein